MSSSLTDFEIGLYTEHLEEASFLYEQRRELLRSPDFGWPGLRDFELRLEAHIDALLVGGDLALQVCRSRLVEGDAGELFAVVCVTCRQQRAALLNEVWRSVDFADPVRLQAVTDALKFELPASWSGFCERLLVQGGGHLLPVLAEVCGYRRVPLGDPIARALLAMPGHRYAGAAWALSRLSVSAVILEALERGLYSPHAAVRSASVLGLLWNNRPVAIRACQDWSESEAWPQVYLALSGLRSTAGLLRAEVREGRASPDTLLAFGLLGDHSAVRLLCEQLENDALADAAARALYWITGAQLYEDVLIEEDIHEDELFDAEKRVLRETGQNPVRDDGTPFGVRARRLTRDPDVWQRWLNENSHQFDSQLRYRLGRPHSPTSVIRGLVEQSVPHALRQWSYEELSIRYSCPVAFEADWRVDDQVGAIRAMAAWATENQARIGAGEWR